jgi:hypothetical protein
MKYLPLRRTRRRRRRRRRRDKSKRGSPKSRWRNAVP